MIRSTICNCYDCDEELIRLQKKGYKIISVKSLGNKTITDSRFIEKPSTDANVLIIYKETNG